MNTPFTHHGMKGTDLPPLPTVVQWKIGSTAEVSWNIRFNHGGGYAYRLCPTDQPLTEASFKKHHLTSVQDKQQLLFPNGSRVAIPNPVFVNIGTVPPGADYRCLALVTATVVHAI